MTRNPLQIVEIPANVAKPNTGLFAKLRTRV